MKYIDYTYIIHSDVPNYIISPNYDPVLGPNVALEVDGADVVPLCPGGFPVDGTLQHPGVLAGRAADGADVDDGHLPVYHLAPRLYKLACLSAPSSRTSWKVRCQSFKIIISHSSVLQAVYV